MIAARSPQLVQSSMFSESMALAGVIKLGWPQLAVRTNGVGLAVKCARDEKGATGAGIVMYSADSRDDMFVNAFVQ